MNQKKLKYKDGIESKLDLDKVWNKDRWVDV